jgi:hypothetical protein
MCARAWLDVDAAGADIWDMAVAAQSRNPDFERLLDVGPE